LARRNGHLDSAGLRLKAADELASGTDIDQSPRTIFFVHGIFVGLAHESQITEFGFDEIVHGIRETAKLAIVKLYAASILLAPPNHFLLFLAAAFRLHAQPDGHARDENESREKHDKH
jgi:hypothetical protein